MAKSECGWDASKFNTSRFYTQRNLIDENREEITLSGEDVKHIRDVLRMTPGDSVTVFDGEGNDYQCRLTQIEMLQATARIVTKSGSTGEPPVKVFLYQGMPKGDKFDSIVQKCVEAGVYSITPVLTSRSLFKPPQKQDRRVPNWFVAEINGGDKDKDDDKDGAAYSPYDDKKLRRWNRISYEAAKQSGRGIVPVVKDFVGFSEAVKSAAETSDTLIIPYEYEKDVSLKSVLRHCTPLPPGTKEGQHSISVFIGPEGGFEPAEVETAVAAGAKTVSLGPRILRTETAGIVVVSSIMYELAQ